jgi:phage terminase large subunit
MSRNSATKMDLRALELRRLQLWRGRPSHWVKDKVDIDLARYRDMGELRPWLERQPRDEHQWLRKQLALGSVTFDGKRSYQSEALDAMAIPGSYAFPWANGTAKTTTAALFILWFLDVYPGGKVVTTAGTWSQLTQQLWREIATWNKHSHDTLVNQAGVKASSINIAPDWFAIGRAANREETFEGIHGQFVAVIMDEAKAIPIPVFDAVRRILRGTEGKYWWICLSSPGSPSGPFYSITNADQAHRWKTFRLSAYESSRVTLDQVEQDGKDLGESSPLFISMDLGEFPEEGTDTIIPLSWVQAAVERRVIPEKDSMIGIDVSRFGGDETVFCKLEGRRADFVEIYSGKDLMQTAGLVKHYAASVKKIAIDDIGLGGGVTDRCREQGVSLIPINAGARASHSEKYANLGGEMMWALREAFRESFECPDDPERGISIPDDRKLVHQLAARKYDFTSDGKIKAESKADMRRRGERSPDRADALAMAWWLRRKRGSQEAFAWLAETGDDAREGGDGDSLWDMDF